ncbi:MAG: hypothetical protein LGB70_00870, partial [Sulfurovum sp.]|nr:hypothetical protein [Sulfurovum sp.]
LHRVPDRATAAPSSPRKNGEGCFYRLPPSTPKTWKPHPQNNNHHKNKNPNTEVIYIITRAIYTMIGAIYTMITAIYTMPKAAIHTTTKVGHTYTHSNTRAAEFLLVIWTTFKSKFYVIITLMALIL